MKKFYFLLMLIGLSTLGCGQATLPFSYDGGKPSGVTGLTHTGLGSDYSSSPKMKFDGTGDKLILNFTGSPGTLTFKIKWNQSTSATRFPGDFTIQESADGSTYSTVQLYNSTTGTALPNGTVITETFASLNSATRYIKWVYTAKSNGNIAIGAITLGAAALTPSITLTPTTLTDFTYVEGSGPSTEQTFTVSGSNLTADISISASTNYEISKTSGGGYTTPLTFTPSSGSVAETTVYVRLKAGLTVGSYNSETITASSTDADNKTVTCSGSVTAPPDPEPTNHATGFSATANSSSQITVNWTDATGGQVPAGYLIKAAISPATPTAPVDGTAEADGALVKNIAHGGSASTVFTGLNGSTTYNFAIWPYTNSGATINYKTSPDAPTANATTTAAPTLKLAEDFNYANGALLTDNGWTSQNAGGTNAIDVTVPGLSLKDYVGSGIGGAARMDNTGEDDNKTFTAQSSGVLYTAATVQINANTTQGYFFHLSKNPAVGTDYHSRVFVKNTADGIQITDESGTPSSWLPVTTGVPFVIVIKHDFSTHETKLYILDSFTSSEPASADATISEPNIISLGSVCLRQFDNEQNIIVDGIRVTTSWEDLVPPTFTGTGNWTDAARWSKGAVPTSSENAIIDGNVTVAAPASIIGLTLKSDATGTASLIGQGNLTVSGTTVVERYVSPYSGSSDGWHFLSSPVNSMTIAGSDFVTGTYDLYRWGETTVADEKWLNYDGGSFGQTEFENGLGYLYAHSVGGVLEFSGTLNSGSYNKSLSYTAGEGDGWNLIGNPYPSGLNWNALDKTANIGESFYIVNPDNGSYKSSNGVAGDFPSGYIPPHQGFFVKVDAATTIGIETADQVHTTNNFEKSSDSFDEILSVDLVGSNSSNKTYFQFRDDATQEFDFHADAYKLYGWATIPQVYSKLNGVEYSINCLPHSEETITVPLGVSTQTNEQLTFNFSGMETFYTTIKIELEDKTSGVTQNIKENPTYTFQATPQDGANRFLLHFNGVTAVEGLEASKTRVYSVDNALYVSSLSNLDADILVYNVNGQLVAQEQMNGESLKKIDFQAAAGIYLVSIQTEGSVETQKVYVK